MKIHKSDCQVYDGPAFPTGPCSCLDYSHLPSHIETGLRDYIENHNSRGGFLTACLENNFVEAALRADPIARAALWGIAKFLYNEAPMDCWGSQEKLQAWLSNKQAIGMGLID